MVVIVSVDEYTLRCSEIVLAIFATNRPTPPTTPLLTCSVPSPQTSTTPSPSPKKSWPGGWCVQDVLVVLRDVQGNINSLQSNGVARLTNAGGGSAGARVVPARATAVGKLRCCVFETSGYHVLGEASLSCPPCFPSLLPHPHL